MGETGTLLAKLVAISKLDGKLAALIAERKKTEKEIQDKTAALKKAENDKNLKTRALQERQGRYQKEEEKLKDERSKLVTRRKALTTLNNYKLQQAAEREIEHTSKDLDAQEDSLLRLLEEVEALGTEEKALEAIRAALAGQWAELEKDARAILTGNEERQRVLLDEKMILIKELDAPTLQTYERVHERHPGGAVVAMQKNGTCAGCYMQLGPQTVVQLGKGDQLIKCRGCGRILALEESEEE